MNFNNSLLFIDDDKNFTRLIQRLLKKEFNIYTANNKDGCLEILNNKDVAVIISDYSMPEINGIDLLTLVKDRFPMVRRVLLSGQLDLNTALESVKKAEIHSILTKPFQRHELIDELKKQVSKFNEDLSQHEKFHEMEILIKETNSNKERTDELLDLLFNLHESGQVQAFTSQFISIIEGMKSLAILNAELYLESRDEKLFKKTLGHLSDIEVFANQFDQKIVLMYVLLIRSYLFLLEENFDQARVNYKGVNTIHFWLKDSNIDKLFLRLLKTFPFPNIDSKKEIRLDNMEHFIEISIRKLFDIDMSNLINISESMLKYYTDAKSSIQYFMILRDELSIYDKIAKNSEVSGDLISAFVIALSKFLQEVVKASGDIETITHANGVILFHKTSGNEYILLAKNNDVRLRIALRQISFEINPIIAKIPKNYLVSETEKEKIDKLADEMFGEF